MTAPVCPECADGKCGNCNGSTWDLDVDAPAACPCTHADDLPRQSFEAAYTGPTLAELSEHYGVREWGFQAPLAVRLLRRLVDEDGCWLFQGRLNPHGYGGVNVRPHGIRLIHRVSYEFFVGPIPDGLQIDHLCRRRNCARPLHLEPVTARENTMRGEGRAAKQARQTHCIYGHEFTPENTRLTGRRRACKACSRGRAIEFRLSDPWNTPWPPMPEALR